MEARRRILDDIAQLVTSAAGVMQGAGQEVEQLVRQRFDRLLDSMELVTREEFDTVKAMAEAARLENEALAKRLDSLEPATPAKRKPKSKPAKSATASPKSTKAAKNKGAGTKSGSKAKRGRQQATSKTT